MKTICFVVPVFPSISETFVTNQIVQAKEKGYRVFVLTHRLVALEHSTQQDLLLRHAMIKDTVVIDYNIPKSKIKRFVAALFPIVKYFKYWIQTPKVSFRHRIINLPFLLKFYGKLRHVDVFHVQFAMAGIGIAEMKENGLLKAKLITTFHGYDAHYNSDELLKQLQNRYRVLLNVSNYITVNTPYLETKVIELGCEKMKLRIIPMGIDVAYFKSNIPKQLPTKGEIRLISVGRLIKLKGFEVAIEAVKILVDKGVNVQYTIVGEGNLFNSLQHQISTFKLQKHVSLVGRKDQDDIRQLLDAHHLFLMSSITDSRGKSEAQGLVTAEAQAMGLPVIAFASGGIPDTIQDGKTGILVDEQEVEAYANTIIELIENPNIYAIMSRKAREFVKAEFSDKLMIKRFIRLYG